MKYLFLFLYFVPVAAKAQDDEGPALPSQSYTHILFPGIDVMISHFNPFAGLGERNFVDTPAFSPVWNKGLLSLHARKDTVTLEENPDNVFRNNLVRIVPAGTGEIRASFCYNYRVYEPYEGLSKRSFDEWEKNQVGFSGSTAFEPMMDSAACYFRAPEREYNYYEQALKKEMALKDTLVQVLNEFPETATVVHKHKACVYRIDNICIRISRYEKGTLKEEKYIVIWYDYYG